MPPIKKSPIEKGPTFLRAWRKFRNMTQVEAAQEFDMDNTNLSKIERGVVPYSQSLLETASRLYECSVGDLLERDPKQKKSMLDLWVNGTPEQIAEIERYARYVLSEGDETSAD